MIKTNDTVRERLKELEEQAEEEGHNLSMLIWLHVRGYKVVKEDE